MGDAGKCRVDRPARVDREKYLPFTFDGRNYSGLAGDTLASALLANGVRLIGRSFKYHRPRGIFSAGVEEPSALVTLHEGTRREPNSLATTTELASGLVAHSQNCWPSPRLDLMSFNQVISPLLAAGFYYKTFMGPTRGSWMWYEPMIRRAAGLGKAGLARDPDRYEARNAFCDCLIVGGGPAGLAAAIAISRSGARVMLVEQDFLLGGSVLREPADSPASNWLAERQGELAARKNCEVLTRTTAAGLYDGNSLALIQSQDHLAPDPRKGQPRQRLVLVRAKSIIFATGATERPLVFGDNDRPGVMLASAARTYLNRYAVCPGREVVVVTNNDSAYAGAFDLADAGAKVTLCDLRYEMSRDLKSRARRHGVEVMAGTSVTAIRGATGVRGAQLAEIGDGQSPSYFSLETRACDLVCCSGGWSPNVHLTSHTGIRPVWREDIAGFVPGPLGKCQFAVGALAGKSVLGAAIEDATRVAAEALDAIGMAKGPAIEIDAPEVESFSPLANARWQVPPRPGRKAFVDLQNDVTVKDVELAHREGYQSVEHLKRYTTLGMGTDQGKTSNINAMTIMAGLRGEGETVVGTTTFRPPFTPVTMGALAGRNIGESFRPFRLSPLHDWHVANGGVMIEVGPWQRPWYYEAAGKSVDEAYVQEMKWVRGNVAIADISTLGKIHLAGPDATEFLNRVYVNGFAKLAIGRCRYGVMLRDDGLVLDDGTTTRLSECEYFMTTTTSKAGDVMAWLEFLLQAAWPDLRVQVTSITDCWAGMAVAGPNSRKVLQAAFPDAHLSNEALSFMGYKRLALDGVEIRILRLSFSGELAYEVYVPSSYAIALWRHIMEAGRPFAIHPYGLEALAALRIEKGHPAGGELDNRVTLDDLGLAKMASTRKAFVGDSLRKRERLTDPARPSLVGLECLEDDKTLRNGAILFAADDEISGHGRGHVTSVTFSPERDKVIALGFYSGGLKHVGKEAIAAYPLRGEIVRVRIVSPHFLDAEGERLRA